MRIRKHQLRGKVGVEFSSGAQRPDPGSQEQSELGLSSRAVKEIPDEIVQTDCLVEAHKELDEGSGSGARMCVPRVIERVDSTSRSAFTWLDKLRHSKGFTELEPYSNLEDFVSSLTKKDDGRGSTYSEEIMKGIDLSRLVEGVDLNVHQLVRHSPVCSESSSKHLNVGSRPPALISYNVTTSLAHENESFNVQLQSDVGLPSAADRVKDTVDAFTEKISDIPGEPSQGAEILERLLFEGKRKGEERHPHRKSLSYWGQPGNTLWMRRSLVSSEIGRGYGESSGKKDFKGTSSKNPVNYEITDVSCQPATVEVVFEQRHVGPGDTSASIAKSVGTRHGALPRIAPIWNPPETEQRRSIRDGRIPSSTVAGKEPDLQPTPPLSPHHPAQQMKDSLEFSLYTVLLRAGKAGLTAREAMSDIRDHCLAGFDEGTVQSSRHIAKLLRGSPYYMEVGEGKFALCTAVVESEKNSVGEKKSLRNMQEAVSLQSSRSEKVRLSEVSTADDSKSLASSVNKAPSMRKKRNRAVREALEVEIEVRSKPVRTGRPKKLKYMKQENAENLGNQCNRTDGKGWVCPLLAKPGYQLCDHHLNKLRCKPGSRSKKKLMKMAAVEVEAAISTFEEPHLVDTARHELTTS